ncbi:MFS transporter [Comamonas terrigena]|uniref:MFS transporter n=1 Tax=Comamonas terrigena TaxID=32013 RepID=UPI0024493DA4|nr:MFS transporter [Comamonas terrigena]MDH0051389.1 MFS transporter [Comamonas terrigena]MDH0513801.1 MFS transporter [Comamonas terrigena]MDH1093338.1 MFS transporter [Comamonas terrigena]MDH1502927.1 MFS transporter [Comamonas terrigena]
MFKVLSNKTYARLLSAQIIALLGTGLATVALGLLAYEIAPQNAGAVLGTALAIKMVAYVGIAPIATALAERLPRKKVLITLDLIRALVVLALPFVTQVWQVYVLIFVLQSASAGFTPTFQATIPDVLPNEDDYTQALSLSRMAYDLESLISPMLAAALLGVMSFSNLFVGTSIGFIASACLVTLCVLPTAKAGAPRGFYERTTRGLKIYLATPRLRGLLAITLCAAAASAMVLVNTVVIVQGNWGLTERDTAWALAAFGAGSMLAALVLPKLLHKVSDRNVMLGASTLLLVALLVSVWGLRSMPTLFAIWGTIGLAYGMAQTPSGRLLRRSAHAEDRPAVFAAHFALSHACWLLTYLVAGHVGAALGITTAAACLAGLTVLGIAIAHGVWPAEKSGDVMHVHSNLDASHEHWHAAPPSSSHELAHRHEYVIDDLHPHWPR